MKRNVLAASFCVSVVLIGVVALVAQQTSLQRGYVFDNVREGQTLSGEISIAARNLSGYYMVDLWLDGKRYSSSGNRTHNNNLYATFGIPTYEYANGLHTLEVKVGQQTLDTRHVVFQNNRLPLRATSLTRTNKLSHITGTVYPDAPWKAVIQNSHGQTLRSWHGDGYSINLSWNGIDNNGRLVADGTYRFIVTTEVLGETFSCPVVKKMHTDPSEFRRPSLQAGQGGYRQRSVKKAGRD